MTRIPAAGSNEPPHADRPRGGDKLTSRLTEPPIEAFVDPSPTKRRIYHLLIEDHLSIPRSAEILKVSRQTAHKHARDLEATGTIARIRGSDPLAFEPGRNAGAFLRVARQSAHRPGRSSSSPPRIAARIHRDSWKWKIRSGPRLKPPWSEEWEASGVENFALRLRLKDGREFRVWESRGKNSASLVVQPPDYLAYDKDDLAKAGRRRELEVARLARTFADTYGYQFDGRLEIAQPAEAAVELPGVELQNAGIPGRTRRWTDHSMGEARGEVETMSMSDTEKYLEYPDWKDRVDTEIAAGKLALQDLEDRVGELAKLQRRTTELAGHATAIQAHELVERINGNGGQHA